MDIKRIAEAIIPHIISRLKERSEQAGRESAGGSVQESAGVEGSEWNLSPAEISRWEWRRISSDVGDEDLSPDARRAIQQRAYKAWCTNPLAGQIVNLTTWFVMGKGVGFAARDPHVQDLLGRFWNHPDNDMSVMQHWMSNELQVYGEIFVRYFVNPISGEVRIAMIDPLEIRDILTDPQNVRRAVSFLREYQKPPSPDQSSVEFLSRGESGLTSLTLESAREVIDADQILHVKVNNVSNQKRGISELYRVLRWLDAYDRWLEDRISINRARGTFAFLRKVPTAPLRASSPFQTDASGKITIPKPGSILVVHQGEDWEVLSPGIGADDAREDGRAIKLMIAAGSGIFEHYFGDPSTGNLATARSMELPMVRKFEDRQRLFENVFSKIFQRVIDAGLRAGMIPVDADRTVDVNFPPIMPDDVALLTDTLIDQVEAGILSKESARRMIPWISDAAAEAEAVGREQA
jgi:hypothetical protein